MRAAGFMPGTFEPEDQLGDTVSGPLDPWTARRIEQRGNRRMYRLVVLFALLCYFGLIA